MKSDNPKILIATGIYPPDIGGPATYSKILNDSLSEYGYSSVVVSFGAVRRLPKILRHSVYFFKLLKASRGAEIIFAQDPVSVGLPALFVSKITRKPLLLKIVGDYAWEQGMIRFGVKDRLDEFSLQRKGYGLAVSILKRVEKVVARGAIKIIVPSEYLKKIVSNWGISPQKIAVVYNAFGAGFSFTKEDKNETKKELGLLGRRVIVSAGRLVPWKGFLELLEIMPEIFLKYPDAVLLIAGEGPLRAKIEKRTKELGLGENIRLLGKLPKENLFRYLSVAEVFVLNTSYEGFSHQLLEVMSSGVPIVTTAVGGNPEIVKDGENGFLVKYGDGRKLSQAIQGILSDGLLAGKLAEEGKKTAGGFTKDRMLVGLVAVIAGLKKNNG